MRADSEIGETVTMSDFLEIANRALAGVLPPGYRFTGMNENRYCFENYDEYSKIEIGAPDCGTAVMELRRMCGLSETTEDDGE